MLFTWFFLFSSILSAQDECLCYFIYREFTLIIHQKHFIIITSTAPSRYYYFVGDVNFKKINKGVFVKNEALPKWEYEVNAQHDTLSVAFPFYTEDENFDFFENLELTFLNANGDTLRESYISKPSIYMYDVTKMPQGLSQINVTTLIKNLHYKSYYENKTYTINLDSTKNFRHLLLTLKSTSSYYLHLSNYIQFDYARFKIKGDVIFINTKNDKYEGNKINCDGIADKFRSSKKEFKSLFINLWGNVPKELME